jgi:hypothetical protein
MLQVLCFLARKIALYEKYGKMNFHRLIRIYSLGEIAILVTPQDTGHRTQVVHVSGLAIHVGLGMSGFDGEQ